MKKTFTVGETVIYKNKGVCKITAIEKKTFLGTEAEYYVLSSVFSQEYKSFVPVNSEAAESIKYVPDKEQIDKMIKDSVITVTYYETEKKRRAEYYAEITERDDMAELLSLHKLLVDKRSNASKIPAADANMIAYIEKVINERFSFALGIQKYEVADYIETVLAQ